MKIKWRNAGIILAFLILLAAVGATLAFMFRETDETKNILEPAAVSCEISERFDGTSKSSVRVQNTGSTEAFLRLSCVSYWVDDEGNIVGKASEMPEIPYDAANWIKDGNIYYYRNPVAPEKFSAELLTAPIVLAESSYLDMTVYQVVELFAEAIQSNPPDAAAESWGVTVTDGSIS